MTDSYGRTLDYLRLSLTDRCNMRCLYCMPPGGVDWRPHGEMLSFEEILRLCRLLAGLGIQKIKVTGGEPLARKGAAALIASLKAIPGIAQVTLTTNGTLLMSFLRETGAGAPDAINISLDTLDPARYSSITRSEGLLTEALAGMEAALERGIPVKINCVPVRGVNEEDLPALAALARDRPLAVRFIELMPAGCAARLEPVPGGEVRARLEAAFGPLTPWEGAGALGNGPAVYYSAPGFTGKIGFINPLSDGFCGTCRRLRLSSVGLLQPCLSSPAGADLKALLRSGASDEALSAAVTAAAAAKPSGHTFSYSGPSEGLFRIGG